MKVRVPDELEIRKRMALLVSTWENRVLPGEVVCEYRFNDNDDCLYFKMTRSGYRECISFTVGEVYDMASVLTLKPELITLHCVADKDWKGNNIEEVYMQVGVGILRRELYREYEK